LEVIMATLRWRKSRRNGDLNEPGELGGTIQCQQFLS
jgi:hypothetical protein